MRLDQLNPRMRAQAEAQLGISSDAPSAASPAQTHNPCRPFGGFAAHPKKAKKASASAVVPTAPSEDVPKLDASHLEDYTPTGVENPVVSNLRADKMSKTEIAFQRDVLHGKGWFEPITLTLHGGSRYTPDFLTLDGGNPTLWEIKGAYRLGSEGRAHTAFFEAAAQFRGIFRFAWAVKEKGNRWVVKHVVDRLKPLEDTPQQLLPLDA